MYVQSYEGCKDYIAYLLHVHTTFIRTCNPVQYYQKILETNEGEVGQKKATKKTTIDSDRRKNSLLFINHQRPTKQQRILRLSLKQELKQALGLETIHTLHKGNNTTTIKAIEKQQNNNTRIISRVISIMSADRKVLVVLVSNGVSDLTQASNQRKARTILKAKNTPHVEVDGMSPEHRERYVVYGVRVG